jgi:hypothetical protein
LIACGENKSTPISIKLTFSLPWERFCLSSKFLRILWKSKNLNFGHVSLNMTNSAAPQMDIETRYPDPILHKSRSGFPQQPVTKLLFLKTDRGTQPPPLPSAAWVANNTQSSDN